MRQFAGIGLALLITLAACGDTGGITKPPALKPTPAPPSEASAALRSYYSKVQADLLTRGLLRTDGGGPDTPFTPDILARNFERIAFYDEYSSGGGLERSSGQAGQLRRWNGPIKINVEFGPSVPEEQRAVDRATVAAYVPRLANTTGHAVRQSGSKPNFHVLVMGADDRNTVNSRLDSLLPNASPKTRALFANPPRNIYCFVVALASDSNPNVYTSAVALVRAEHPDLLRKSCFHEEIAQGLGLANDSPEARPSIFNDDEEFALLTTHDEKLLSMLYDDRLSTGMSVGEARPIVYILAREQTAQNF
ncbi:Protein of unknown function [Shimia sagamensis]|uniref:Lipoprotein n=1 Tax=Shimia sagamensis TaxID=1566352 RepID=A0ABY1NVI3_9RHOB|nr:Protein of unknown function [Shimia sagamensis]